MKALLCFLLVLFEINTANTKPYSYSDYTKLDSISNKAIFYIPSKIQIMCKDTI